jgi:uncharacterized phage-like protein YoqJ
MGARVIIAGTGHRPKDFTETNGSIEIKAATKLRYPNKSGLVIETFICGMAEGFDLLAAKAAMELELEVWAARPWTGHYVSCEWQNLYDEVIDYASKIVVVTKAKEYPGHWCMFKRNEWMVDNCDAVMAYWNPEKESGGTYGCIQYAKKVGKPVANIYFDPPF